MQQELKIPGPAVVIASEVMRQLMRAVERMAQSNASVLIQGESGSGKEVVARALHAYSTRRSWQCVEINCAALPEQLAESELFGHEKGAFSGAESAKPGLFELASGGTIFLDEIGELEARMQSKLLRVLDGVPYYRVGGVRKITADVRVIAATNMDLRKAVAQRRFREDLFHRLTELTIDVPPLRERVDDIIPLAEHFLAQQRPGLSLDQDTRRLLRQYEWPGNVRELRNVMIKAAIAVDGSIVPASALNIGVHCQLASSLVQVPAPTAQSLDVVEREMILRAVRQTSGNCQRAADLLGISRRTLARRLKTYGAETPSEGAYVC